MQRTTTIIAACLLAGCGTLDGKLDNVLVVTPSGDRAFVNSLYGPIGISAELRKQDAAALRRLQSQAAAAAAPASAP